MDTQPVQLETSPLSTLTLRARPTIGGTSGRFITPAAPAQISHRFPAVMAMDQAWSSLQSRVRVGRCILRSQTEPQYTQLLLCRIGMQMRSLATGLALSMTRSMDLRLF